MGADPLKKNRMWKAQSVEVALRYGAAFGPVGVVVVPPPDPPVGGKIFRRVLYEGKDPGKGAGGREVEEGLLLRPGGEVDMAVRDARKDRFPFQLKLPAGGAGGGADLLLGARGGDEAAREKKGVFLKKGASVPEGSSCDEQTVHGYTS
ncbi:hypothetical protein MASR2M17_20970 [Aminivibrio sp.]